MTRAEGVKRIREAWEALPDEAADWPMLTRNDTNGPGCILQCALGIENVPKQKDGQFIVSPTGLALALGFGIGDRDLWRVIAAARAYDEEDDTELRELIEGLERSVKP